MSFPLTQQKALGPQRAESWKPVLLEQARSPAQTFCQGVYLPVEALSHTLENLSPSSLIDPRSLFTKPQPALNQI